MEYDSLVTAGQISRRIFHMVKLIFSDIDGTLLPYGQTAIDPALFPLIRELRRRDILFCPASGRQYHSLRSLFVPAAEELCFLCENGAILYGPGPEEDAPILAQTVMDREDVLSLAEDMVTKVLPQITLSGAKSMYTLAGCGDAFVRYMRDVKNCAIQVLQSLAEVPEDIMKVSVYCPGGTDGPQAILGPRWADKYHMAAAGPDWVDFTLADKGTGVQKLCAALGISPADAMAFGDNWNDAAMLSAVGTPWLMEQADPALLERFPNHCGNVLDILRQLLNES